MAEVYSAANGRLMALLGGPPLRVLDVGCGTGQAMWAMAGMGHHVTGVTISAAEAEAATSQGLNVLCIDADAGLPFADGEFDALFLSHVLEHLKTPHDSLKAMCRLLRPGGHCLIALPNVANWRPRLQLALGRFPQTDMGVFDNTHLRFYTFWSARKMVESAGLKIDQHLATVSLPMGPLRRVLGPIGGWLDRLGSKMAPNLLAWETIIVARQDP